ncbi:MAG: VanW family protein [Fimbriimonadaceae bacterium]|nr:VanW family protein [Fimbriimonadaceae bacterium]
MTTWSAVGVIALGLATTGYVASTPGMHVAGEYSTSLIGRTPNQRHNAVQAVQEVNGIWVQPGETFSFNRHVRGWTKDRGYRKAPVSYNGQLVVAWGGGVCQASTTLYNAALISGMQIVERNRHHFAPSYVPPGRDAAVAYENIDLRFRNPYQQPVQITGKVEANRIVFQIVSSSPEAEPKGVYEEVRAIQQPRTFTITSSERKLRNSGKAGFESLVWRDCGEFRELISHDNYPTMDRIIEER